MKLSTTLGVVAVLVSAIWAVDALTLSRANSAPAILTKPKSAPKLLMKKGAIRRKGYGRPTSKELRNEAMLLGGAEIPSSPGASRSSKFNGAAHQ
ncbi:hypothetical protein H4R35_004184 [Dimargaris xerosporica]|nr:hypothetical protein H4R35_004184 [Dimargaris xerosporica]